MSALWRESSGLILLLGLFAALVGGRRLRIAVLHVRLLEAADRPLPGRTRDLTWDIDLSDQPHDESPGQILSRPPRPYRPNVPGLPPQRSRAS